MAGLLLRRSLFAGLPRVSCAVPTPRMGFHAHIMAPTIHTQSISPLAPPTHHHVVWSQHGAVFPTQACLPAHATRLTDSPFIRTFTSSHEFVHLADEVARGDAVSAAQAFKSLYSRKIVPPDDLLCDLAELAAASEDTMTIKRIIKLLRAEEREVPVGVYASALYTYSLLQNEDAVRHYFGLLKEKFEDGSGPPVATLAYNAMINVVLREDRLGNLDEATELLHEMRSTRVARDLDTFVMIIEANVRQGRSEEATTLFQEMYSDGILPTSAAMDTLVETAADVGDFEFLMPLAQIIFDSGMSWRASSLVSIMSMCALHGRTFTVDRLLGLLEDLKTSASEIPPKRVKDLFTGLGQTAHVDVCWKAWDFLRAQGVRLDEHIAGAILDSHLHDHATPTDIKDLLKDLRRGTGRFKEDTPLTPQLYQRLAMAYALEGEEAKMQHVLDKYPVSELLQLRTQMMAHVALEKPDKARKALAQMWKISPASVTTRDVNAVIGAYVTANDNVQPVVDLVDELETRGLSKNVDTYQWLLVLYTQSGQGDKAVEVVNEWEAMGGYKVVRKLPSGDSEVVLMTSEQLAQHQMASEFQERSLQETTRRAHENTPLSTSNNRFLFLALGLLFGAITLLPAWEAVRRVDESLELALRYRRW